jgi:hypothetical protein
VDIRVGLHTREVQVRGADVGGIAVHITARVLAAAGASEALVSRTVGDLVAGSDYVLEDRAPTPCAGWPARGSCWWCGLSLHHLQAARRHRLLPGVEAGRLSEGTCGHRVGALEQEILALEGRRAKLEAECDSESAVPSGGELTALRRQAGAGDPQRRPEQLQRLLDAVVGRMTVDSCACIRPYFVAPTVRTRTAPRRPATRRQCRAGEDPTFIQRAFPP